MIFRKIAEWFSGRKRSDDRHPLDYINNKYNGEPAAPYKVEPAPVAEPVAEARPEPTKCGCGRSSTGFCVGLHRLTEAEWAVHADNPKKTEAVTEVKRPRRASKPRAEKPEVKPAEKTVEKKSAAKKTGAKPAPKKAEAKPQKAAAAKTPVSKPARRKN